MIVDLREDMAIIPLGGDSNIVYAPLHGSAFYVNDKAAEVCKSYIEGCDVRDDPDTDLLRQHIKTLEAITAKKPSKPSINTGSNLVIILSQMCNLACTYCYAQESRSKEVLKKEQIKAAIDFILSQESKNKHFSFIGGGEPTLTWDLLKWAISYIRDTSVEQHNINISITTNGTLLDEDRIDFLKQNDVKVGISFEILPEIQSSQRCYSKAYIKSFDVVDKAIKRLANKHVNISFRSTITKLNVKRMPEMVQFVLKSYPYVKKLHFEHVTSTDNDKTFYDAFINSFIEAQRIGRENGIDVYCSGSRGIAKIKYSFCRGEFCLTPTGEIVACHRVSSKEDKAFGLYKYAEVKNGSVLIDSSKKKSVEEYFYGNHSECKTCFAKWHCAGSCPTERSVYSDEMMELKCYFTKGLTKALLVEQLNRHVSI